MRLPQIVSAFFIVSTLLLGGCSSTPTVYPTPVASDTTGTHVRLMRGMGGKLTSPGVDQIGQQAAQVKGVTKVVVYDYTQDQQLVADVNAEPPTVKQVIGGYSCGANASPVAAGGVKSVAMMTTIQASLWCGGALIPKQVQRAQETYNASCWQTLGFGCYLLNPGPGFPASHFTVINRPDCHPCADTDPNTQADMIAAIKSVASPNASSKNFFAAKAPSTHIRVIVRYNGQRAY
jgi:hypothetical protein